MGLANIQCLMWRSPLGSREQCSSWLNCQFPWTAGHVEPRARDRAVACCPSPGITFRAAGGHSLILPGRLPQAAIYQADKEGFSLPLELFSGEKPRTEFWNIDKKAKGGSHPPSSSLQVTIADDYSDPFDAKNDLKSKVGKGESAGYMEPYEAQRIMTEFQRQESVRSQHKGIQLYDTPYEPEGQSVDSDSESTVSPRLRESKLPQDDDRPADEYDQPWEWNRVTIPALAAQFNGNEKRQSSPSPSRDRRRQLRAPGGGFKPIKHGSPEFCGILGERVDPAVPLEKQIWYHGAISRGDAENLLRLCKECSYLVRNSQTSKHDYSLSLKSNQGFMHMKLAKTKEKYILGQNSPPFDSVPEVIHYYTTRKLPIKGAEHLSLLYPVAVRTL
ncbi:SH2 domain-containing adapter protein B [Carlito syrichta]|uniref:SH2 domain-containing adapter protein B n=1 Tax=Carlito syrichta TaxID=1868482 RepID=A0A3Q0DUU1_CARSF|nr:SH2 domain-containing adapter protein B [Carlito syrichta]